MIIRILDQRRAVEGVLQQERHVAGGVASKEVRHRGAGEVSGAPLATADPHIAEQHVVDNGTAALC